MKKLMTMTAIACMAIVTMAQSIKGPDKISYFQAPANGVEFKSANVFMSHDQQLATAKKENQQEKNSAMGASFGAVGTAVADAANKGLDMVENFNKMLDAYKDDKGRFARWNFVPSYIIAEANTKKSVNVEIFVLNEPNPSPSAKMPTQADKNGYYDVPYYVNCRYKITDNAGKVLFDENLGVLEGTQKTKDYTPPAPTTPGASLSAAATEVKKAEKEMAEGNFEDEVPIQDRIGTNKAYNAVRTAVFARYGFGQFAAPIKLGMVKEIKASKKLVKPTVAVFENKKGLLLNKDEKAQVQKLVDVLEKDAKLATDKTRWVVFHNLSVCYAWLENAEKAEENYKKYTDEIKLTLDKMDCWNKVLAGEMTGKEMKAKVGSTFIGGKDMKKFAQYNNIKYFVNYYPKGAQRYEKLLFAINRDLKRFVDFYSVNDLLCQLFEIDYPFQFFPLNDFAGAPKDMKGTITKEGMETIEYRVKFDSKRRIKKLEADQITKLADGSKEKLVTRDLMPVYKDDGSYSHFETDAGTWASAEGNGSYVSLNSVSDPLLAKTKGKADNITKDAGFLGGKESTEEVQLKVDLEGNIYFTGESNYFKANAFFKEMLNASGVTPKRVDTKTDFTTKANINEFGVMTNWRWEGNVITDFAGAMKAKEQNLKAKPMVRGIKFIDVDDKGNPTKVEFEYQMKGIMAMEEKAKGMAFVNKYLVELNGPKPTVSKEGFSFNTTGTWDCTFDYDASNNWTSMKIGPYTSTREFKY